MYKRQMQADGLAKRLEHAHAKTAVIGISGGLDSCLALLVAVRAMKQLHRPAADVLAVTMPCFGTVSYTHLKPTSTTVSSARVCASSHSSASSAPCCKVRCKNKSPQV